VWSHLALGPSRLVTRQLVCQFDPGQLAARPGVVLRDNPLGIVQAANRDVDFLGRVVELESQGRAAPAAKRADCPGGRRETSGFTSGEGKVLGPKTRP